MSEVVSEKVGYNSDDDDDDIVDHEAEKRPKSMPKKATNNSGPMGTDITNSVEEGFPRKRNLSNSEPSQGESWIKLRGRSKTSLTILKFKPPTPLR